jgi:aryl-alcohol dehydrogenase-like predicted oxidoreductase
MGMSDFYGESDRTECIATIHAALECGITLFDTGDFYGMGHNEILLSEALKGTKRENAFIQVKFGAQRDPAGNWLGYDASPKAVKTSLAYTLKRLGTDYVDLYQPARLDPVVPIEETVGAIAELVKAGFVRHIGLSEMGVETIRKAHAVHPIAALQIEYSLMSRSIEAEILPTTRALGISITAYGVLSRGLLAGKGADKLTVKDFRSHSPRWQGENLKRNLALAEALAQIAHSKEATAAQLAIAWVLSRGSDIIPLVGARSRTRLAESIVALDLTLNPAELKQIETAVPVDRVAGSRYAEAQMAMLDSERKRGD